MVILGVPLALPLATLVFVGGFIPYLGGLVATAAILLTALAAIGPEATVVLLVLIVVANLLEDRYIGRVAAGDDGPRASGDHPHRPARRRVRRRPVRSRHGRPGRRLRDRHRADR